MEQIGTRTITRLVRRLTSGAPTDDDDYDLVFRELRRRARRQLGRYPNPQANVTTIINSALLRLLARKGGPVQWKDRDHFYRAAAKGMRWVLIERYHREQRRLNAEKISIELLDSIRDPISVNPFVGLAIHEALENLAREDPEAAQVAELRFFGGYTEAQVAHLMSISERTVTNRWRAGKAYLALALEDAARQPSTREARSVC